MQVNMNTNYNSNPSFGLLSVSGNAKKVIFKRLGSKAADNFVKEFSELKGSHSTNPVEVLIDAPDEYTNNLFATIRTSAKDYDAGYRYYEKLEEGILSKLFSSPMSFIRKCCAKADDVNCKMETIKAFDRMS